MTPRRVAVGLGLVLALGAAGWWALGEFGPQPYIDIDPDQLQARLDAHFPQKNCALLMACVTLATPRVALTEGSERIGLAADVLVSLGHRQMNGRVAFSGVLRYVRYRGEFFVDDLQIDHLDFPGLSPQLVAVVKIRGPAAMRRALEGHPLYAIQGDTAREALAKLAVRDVKVVGGRMRVTFLGFGG